MIQLVALKPLSLINAASLNKKSTDLSSLQHRAYGDVNVYTVRDFR
jgi:hypothetical protein